MKSGAPGPLPGKTQKKHRNQGSPGGAHVEHIQQIAHPTQVRQGILASIGLQNGVKMETQTAKSEFWMGS